MKRRRVGEGGNVRGMGSEGVQRSLDRAKSGGWVWKCEMRAKLQLYEFIDAE